ncbi:YgfZ/GcvT domain-containing protein [Stenotrophomonas rhizophila]|uniref:CAF17-like 4Fe-4S cluster assembly/insertion protein YgfZ n=1 Tax=Stenotrophomonas rhizophila TaxID=216778 RepID=UPI001E3142A9|nr:folate-binding protein [Stenotrophomonas rhizophila]MCC7635905.1 folate-binding protein YgfZ [Stenotrophomonas rhizophila]MCC7665118.1 folate-binding protein YgfZ [Stenotrophomonas rhizophila]
MPDNLPLDFPAYPRLPGHQLLSLDGPDAAAFAHAQFSSDVTALPLRHWQWSAWLNAKGRTIAVFQLLRVDPEQVLLVLADGDADAIASQLQRFVFRRKVKVAVRQDLGVAGSFAAPEAASGAAIAVDGETLELDLGSDALPRTLRIGAVHGAALPDDAAFALAWRQADLRHGLPRLDAGQREQWTPQQLGLDRLNGYSVKKGCYPGQEIVARTHFLGKAKRALQLLRVADGTASGAQVQQNGGAIGSIASVAGDLALAVLPLEIAADPLSVDGIEAVHLPLLDGLAR